MKDKGNPIPENDIWIAATCIVYEISLATNDKHFNNIEGLKLIE
ncbi:MAG: type II toxin-antitoxin system VapC family toxin [Bacteroidetes bacterium]|nr:type II toxin-antitoxin system VapC family toxin [Bacteroidota bacterium]